MSKYIIEASVSEDTICNYCEDHILEVQRGCHCTKHFCCEGRFCQDAVEQYTEEYPETEVWADYEWGYEPSRSVEKCADLLDERIVLLLNLSLGEYLTNNHSDNHESLREVKRAIEENKAKFKKSLKNFAFTI